MTWFRVDDTLAAHPKTRKAGLAAMGLWTVAGSWSSQQLTEGFVPEWFVDTWPQGKKLAAQLVRAGYWTPHEQDDERGWLFHDWTDANPTAEREKERRAKARERQRKMREKSAARREEAFDKAIDADTSRGTSRVTDSVSHAGSHAVSHGAPTRPDPSRPSLPTEENHEESPRGVSYVSDARAEHPPAYPDHCREHADDPTPPDCGRCADARKARERRPNLALVSPQNPARKPHCGQCDETRHRETPFGVIRCPECHPRAEESA